MCSDAAPEGAAKVRERAGRAMVRAMANMMVEEMMVDALTVDEMTEGDFGLGRTKATSSYTHHTHVVSQPFTSASMLFVTKLLNWTYI